MLKLSAMFCSILSNVFAAKFLPVKSAVELSTSKEPSPSASVAVDCLGEEMSINLSNSLSASSVQKIFDGFKVYNSYLNYSVIKSLFKLIILSVNSILKK